MDSSNVVKGVNGGASSWRDNDWMGVAGSLVAHADLWMLVVDLVSSQTQGQSHSVSCPLPY